MDAEMCEDLSLEEALKWQMTCTLAQWLGWVHVLTALIDIVCCSTVTT